MSSPWKGLRCLRFLLHPAKEKTKALRSRCSLTPRPDRQRPEVTANSGRPGRHSVANSKPPGGRARRLARSSSVKSRPHERMVSSVKSKGRGRGGVWCFFFMCFSPKRVKCPRQTTYPGSRRLMFHTSDPMHLPWDFGNMMDRNATLRVFTSWRLSWRQDLRWAPSCT